MVENGNNTFTIFKEDGQREVYLNNMKIGEGSTKDSALVNAYHTLDY